jgi:hypothetical protein
VELVQAGEARADDDSVEVHRERQF